MVEMLPSEKITITTGKYTMDQAQERLESAFGANGYLLAETTREACFTQTVDLKRYISLETISLRGFNRKLEIRMEKEPGADIFRYREIKDNEDGEEAYFLEQEYLLRKTASIQIKNGGSGKSSLVCREYYRCDEDGLALSIGNRLLDIMIREGK
jgi:hypothetical protein